jgi:hypothetical protein
LRISDFATLAQLNSIATCGSACFIQRFADSGAMSHGKGIVCGFQLGQELAGGF